jgi:hypothetical protein
MKKAQVTVLKNMNIVVKYQFLRPPLPIIKHYTLFNTQSAPGIMKLDKEKCSYRKFCIYMI